jgi:DNA polymerase-3 subunit gamma/tau
VSTTSFYRAYRPKKFADVIGQDAIVKILKTQIANNKIAHAYLFCGSRGTGKTTIAKIFANEIVGDNAAIDVFEIDAASNNSVQDVRDLTDKVNFPPIMGKYKVYIIDEVHMFSQSAFNAFLKTLEEPPKHIVFILCTTEPGKIIPTVQSRCLRFDFRAASVKDIKKLITDVFKKEKIEATPDAIEMIAESGFGSYRDALSYAETVASYNEKITAETVAEVIGTVSNDALLKLLESIKSKDIKETSKTCNTIFEKGINVNLLVKNFLEIIKQDLLKSPTQDIQKIFRGFCELEQNIKNSVDPKKHFENTCILCGEKWEN